MRVDIKLKYIYELMTKECENTFNSFSADRANYLLNLELLRKSNIKNRNHVFQS